MKNTKDIIKSLREIIAPRLVATNSGTFGAVECCAKVGTGDPKYGERRIYETFTGARFVVGCDEDEMPGYLRRFTADESPKIRRQKVNELKRELAIALQAESPVMDSGKYGLVPADRSAEVEKIIAEIIHETKP